MYTASFLPSFSNENRFQVVALVGLTLWITSRAAKLLTGLKVCTPLLLNTLPRHSSDNHFHYWYRILYRRR